MKSRRQLLFILAACCFITPPALAPAAGADAVHHPHAGMLRYPDISATHVAFVYANDLWMVPRDGGLAVPLASPPGQEMFPRFSPDGQTLAFVGNYDGGQDLYTVPAGGGPPHRVTHHPADEMLCDWAPGGDLIFFSNGFAGLTRQAQLLTVAARGGLPVKLPVPYGTNGAISPDGEWLAYTPHSHDHRTWKRYRGGMATDLWLFNLKDHRSQRITDWEGTDSQPMWHGRKVYYLSDAGAAHRLDIWVYDTAGGPRQQLTFEQEFDVKWPAMGPGPGGGGEIVFQVGPELRVLDLPTGRARVLQVTMPGDRPRIRPRPVDASKTVNAWAVSPTGKRALFEARGDIWTVPARAGSPTNLTRSSGVAERDPSWSPDGRWVAYFGDATGEYELYIVQSDGLGETRQLTHDNGVFRYAPSWSPDSKHIAFTDKSGAYYLHTLEGGATRRIDLDPWADHARVSFSGDSRWMAYAKSGPNRLSAIWLYDLQEGQTHAATSGMFNDTWPTFDRSGDYLYFASNRDFSSPIYEDVGTTFVYAGTDILLCVPLRPDVASPFAPKSDRETWDGREPADQDPPADQKDDDDDDNGNGNGNDNDNDDDKDDKDAGDDKKEKKKDEKPKPVVIEIFGLERRAVPVPVKRGAFSQLAVGDGGKLFYVRQSPRGGDDKPSIRIFDPSDDEKDPHKKKEEKTVMEEAEAFALSADGKKLLVHKENAWVVVDAAAEQKFENPVVLSAMTVTIEPRAEWKQIFEETWRIQRDFFYDPHMHGVDWAAMRQRYEKMLDDCASREDVMYVIGELIAELNVGHAYARGGGDLEQTPSMTVGLLGADFELHAGAYRIARIYQGATWDADARGPLSQPGVQVHEGDYLLAVNGLPLDVSKDPWAAFLNLGGRVATLTVSTQPVLGKEVREVVVELLSSEETLRYRAWIEGKRSTVEARSGGRIGYLYVPNTGVAGQNDLFRQFYGQLHKEALIIDERWNGGGQIPTRFVELLNRPVANYWAVRDGHDWVWPPDSHQGPKCMLINGMAGSGGDYFPWYFRRTGVGKLIGTRTWGGLVGISGNPQLIDGGNLTAPTFAFYEVDGSWGVEGHGVDPDIEVIDDPAHMVDGGDPQLDAAIEHLLGELKSRPYQPPARPAYPDRSGMGLQEADK